MQTEEMKRLLWDGEIVGHERKRLNDNGKVITEWTSYSTPTCFEWTRRNYIDYNSFELSFKHNGERLFEGDTVEYDKFNGERITGILEYQSNGFCIHKTSIGYFSGNILNTVLSSNPKRIGNIHNEKEGL